MSTPADLPPVAHALVVDDSRTIRRRVQRDLEAAGLAVTGAADGAAARALARLRAPDVILLDIVLPDENGLALLEEFQTQAALEYTPVLMLTRHHDLDLLATALDKGASDYITKPFAARELVARVRVALRTKRRTDELAEARRRLEREAYTDALTQVGNRRLGERELARHVALAGRHRRPLAVALLDFDAFKTFNDTHGHAAGDVVLQTLAGRLSRCLRGPDVLARWGGEEFLVVLPETGAKGAEEAAERLRACIADTPVAAGHGRQYVTASVGCAPLRAGEDADALLARADYAMYAAKRAGGDTVRIAA